MSSKWGTEWSTVFSSPDSTKNVKKLAVPGGWLIMTGSGVGTQVVFTPDSKVDDRIQAVVNSTIRQVLSCIDGMQLSKTMSKSTRHAQFLLDEFKNSLTETICDKFDMNRDTEN